MTLHLSETARQALARLYPEGSPALDALAATDPEFAERVAAFALDQVPSDTAKLPERTRFLSILATLLGCQGIDAFRLVLPAALEAGVTPVEVKEVVYQATAYLGLGRVTPFLAAVNDELTRRGITLPLPAQVTIGTSLDERMAAGEAKQVECFGEGMRGFATSGNPAYPQMNRWLSSNCFGDWYTRGGLSTADRELVTFCYLAAQGGCEPQLTSHARGNLHVGNSRELLLLVVLANVPYIGYPRSLNAIRCVEEATK